MGVKLRERTLSSGETAFYLDVYDRNHGRFSIKTGLRGDPKNRKAYNQVKAAALDKARQMQKDLEFDTGAVFGRKARASEDFIAYFKASIEKTNYSIEVSSLKLLVAFSGGFVSFERLNQGWLEQLKEFIRNADGISQNTAGGYLGVIKKIIKKAWREGYIREDFTGKVACIKKTDIHRRFCTFEEVEALSRARCDHEMVKHAFLFSCFSGLRLSDIELLTWDTISLVNGAPFIQFQQKKTRQFENCPLPEQAVKILTEVKRIHPRYAPDGSNKVFILPDRSSIGIMLKIWGGRAGLSWSLHFHASRHTMATLMLTAGSDIYTVSKQLGHRDIATTQKYSRLIDTKRVAEVQRLPVLSAQPQPVETVPLMIEAKHEEKMQQEPVLASQAGSIAEALQVKGEKIASALSLQRNGEGKYLFNGKEYSAVELALQV